MASVILLYMGALVADAFLKLGNEIRPWQVLSYTLIAVILPFLVYTLIQAARANKIMTDEAKVLVRRQYVSHLLHRHARGRQRVTHEMMHT